MGRLSRFLRLPRTDRRLLLEAALFLAVIRLGLSTLSLARLRSVLTACAGAARDRDDAAASRAVWAVETACRRWPALSTCLTQALAVHVLLARRGIASDVRIGVMRRPDGEFTAHAWLERDGRIVIGEPGHERYRPMPTLHVVER